MCTYFTDLLADFCRESGGMIYGVTYFVFKDRIGGDLTAQMSAVLDYIHRVDEVGRYEN